MLNNISWSEYLTFIAVSSLVYYFFVLFTYYRKDFLRVANANRTPAGDRMNFTYVPLKEPQRSETSYQPSLVNPALDSFMDEVRAYLEETAKTEVAKDVLLECLGIIAGKYPSLAQSEQRNLLDGFICREVEKNCAVLLSESEVRGIWSEA